MIRQLFPRLWYRIQTGTWCDHQNIWIDPTDPNTIRPLTACTPDMVAAQYHAINTNEPVVIEGYGRGELIDMGRAKLFTCGRCGYITTTFAHPIQDMARAFDPAHSMRDGVLALVGLLCGLIALTWLMLSVLPAWADDVAAGLCLMWWLGRER